MKLMVYTMIIVIFIGRLHELTTYYDQRGKKPKQQKKQQQLMELPYMVTWIQNYHS